MSSAAHAADAHAVEAYEPSGVTNAKIGVWLFLASEIMLFATLFTTYIVLRTSAASWPRGWDVLNIPLALTNTFVLISSSMTIVLAHGKTLERDYAAFRKYMIMTIGLAFLFLIFKSFEYGAKIQHHYYPSTNVFFAIYYTMTGLHCLHVVGGIVVNWALLHLSKTQWDHPLFEGRIEGAGLYWHFVDIVWIFLFPALYLL